MTTRASHPTDGNGWVDCACGDRHWGLFGAAGLLLADPSRGVVLQHRALWGHNGGTWGVPGGARSSTETAVAAALRETSEEAAIPPDAVCPSHAWIEDHGTWSYTTVVGSATAPVEPRPSDRESLDVAWIPVVEVDRRPLLPAFGAMWPRIREQLWRRLVIVVDAANVVGSRPDGWWRDRRGAASRLRDELRRLPATPVAAEPLGLPAMLWWPSVVMVTEGAARDISPADGVSVRYAPHSGDDTIVDAVTDALSARPRDHVVVVTADRELRRRVSAAGGRHIGPSVLWKLLAESPTTTSS